MKSDSLTPIPETAGRVNDAVIEDKHSAERPISSESLNETPQPMDAQNTDSSLNVLSHSTQNFLTSIVVDNLESSPVSTPRNGGIPPMNVGRIAVGNRMSLTVNMGHGNAVEV